LHIDDNGNDTAFFEHVNMSLNNPVLLWWFMT